jgi:hypothetical protein
MGKFDRRSRDQKRKAKLKKRAERSHQNESLAYHGNKYKTVEYVRIMLDTETAIYEAFVISGREMTDDEVEAALGRLILGMREGTLRPLPEDGVLSRAEGEDEEFIVANIRRHWRTFAESEPLPRGADLIGVLRTILHSLEIWRSQSMHSQGYLRYLEGFLKKSGVSVRRVTEDLEPLPEPEEDPLLPLGRAWAVGGDREAGAAFKDQAYHLIEAGDAERIIGVAQQLIGESDDPGRQAELSAIALRGHRASRTEMG